MYFHLTVNPALLTCNEEINLLRFGFKKVNFHTQKNVSGEFLYQMVMDEHNISPKITQSEYFKSIKSYIERNENRK